MDQHNHDLDTSICLFYFLTVLNLILQQIKRLVTHEDDF